MQSSTATVSPKSYPAQKKQWTDSAMENALKEVTNNGKTVRHAALEYGIPKSTLHNRVSGKVLPGAVGGAPRYLDDEEEEELIRWLEGCTEVGL